MVDTPGYTNSSLDQWYTAVRSELKGRFDQSYITTMKENRKRLIENNFDSQSKEDSMVGLTYSDPLDTFPVRQSRADSRGGRVPESTEQVHEPHTDLY